MDGLLSEQDILENESTSEKVDKMMVYIIIFGITIFMFYAYEKSGWNEQNQNTATRIMYLILSFAVTCLPMILFYGLRVDVGTDYRSYVDIYNAVKRYTLKEYVPLYIAKKHEIEIGYYLINRVAYLIWDNVHTMFVLTGIIIFAFVFASIRRYNEISYSYAIFVFLISQFATATNIVRSALAYCVILYSFKYLEENKPIGFLASILIATLFHQSAICCIAFWLLREFKSERLNKIRDYLLYIIAVATPVIMRVGILVAMKMPIFEKYFRRYSLDLNNVSLVYLWRCIPAIILIRLLVKMYRMDLGQYKVLMNIQLCRIPLLYIGNYFTYASRLDKFAGVSEIILIPLVIHKINNKKAQVLAYTCFAVLYIFYFMFNNVYQGSNDLFPYQSVIMN